MQNGTVIVFATSFLDEPVAPTADWGKGREILEAAEQHHGIKIEYRCDRNPAEPPSSAELDGAIAIIADLERYDRALLEQVGAGRGGSLGLIARYGIGYTNVDIAAAKECGVLVANAPGANAPPTAEWAVATLLDVAGTRLVHHRLAAQGKPKISRTRLDVGGKTLGVIGTGTIGKQVVELLRGFNMEVIAHDLYPDHDWAQAHGVEYAGFENVLERADFLTLHASSPDLLIGETELARLKRTAVLVNCARGHLVDNRAAYRAVKEGRLWGYGLDEIWEHSDLELEGVNVIVSPHVGSDTDRGKERMQRMTAETVAAYLDGKTPQHIVNR